MLKSEQIRKLKAVYDHVEGIEVEATRVRDLAEDFRRAPSGIMSLKDGRRIEDTEQIWHKNFLHKLWTDYSSVHTTRENELREKIDEILKEKWWNCPKEKEGKLLNKLLILSMPLCVCVLTSLIIVLLGNPLLPIPSLAQQGWAWHHIPELLCFFFGGMLLGVVKNSISVKINWRESVYLVILALFSLVAFVVRSPYTVIPIVTVPSFTGYLVKRWHALRKYEKRKKQGRLLGSEVA